MLYIYNTIKKLTYFFIGCPSDPNNTPVIILWDAEIDAPDDIECSIFTNASSGYNG